MHFLTSLIHRYNSAAVPLRRGVACVLVETGPQKTLLVHPGVSVTRLGVYVLPLPREYSVRSSLPAKGKGPGRVLDPGAPPIEPSGCFFVTVETLDPFHRLLDLSRELAQEVLGYVHPLYPVAASKDWGAWK